MTIYVWSDFDCHECLDLATTKSLFRTEADYAMLAETYFSGLARDGAIYGEIFVSPDHGNRIGRCRTQIRRGLGEGITRHTSKTGSSAG